MNLVYLKLAEDRAKGINSQVIVWQKAAERLGSAGLNEHQIRELFKACEDAPSAGLLAILLNDEGSAGYDLLHETVNDSDFSMEDWCHALVQYTRWIEAHGHEPDIRKAIGYVHCCAMAESLLPLADRTEEMLNEFGVED